jgi:hypothetical protein
LNRSRRWAASKSFNAVARILAVLTGLAADASRLASASSFFFAASLDRRASMTPAP